MWEDSSRTSEGGQLMLEFGIGSFFIGPRWTRYYVCIYVLLSRQCRRGRGRGHGRRGKAGETESAQYTSIAYTHNTGRRICW